MIIAVNTYHRYRHKPSVPDAMRSFVCLITSYVKG